MSCEQYDWKAYALGEITADQRRASEAHGATCEACRSELAHIRLTVDTLSALREEEVPRRIAFVSDKVFEPRWWDFPGRLFSPMFAAACVIALAILAHGFLMRPTVNQAEMDARVDQAVNKAVSDVELRNKEVVNFMQQQMTTMYVKNTGIVRQ